VFTRRVRAIEDKTKTGLAEALKTASYAAVVRSAFDLPQEQRAAIQKALNETFSADIHIRFETAADLIGGIEFDTNGQRVAWSIGDYLTSLETGVEELLKQRGKSEAKAKPAPAVKPEATPAEKATPAPAQPKPGAKSQ
jgi:F-type H+-transporting ATPase subunit b